jgi:hypothetical protein
MGTDACPIWGMPTSFATENRDSRRYHCHRCSGEFEINGTLEQVARNYADQDEFKLRITSWIVRQRQLGIASPKITQEAIDHGNNGEKLSVIDRRERLLDFLVRESNKIGEKLLISLGDNSLTNRALAWSESLNIFDLKIANFT